MVDGLENGLRLPPDLKQLQTELEERKQRKQVTNAQELEKTQAADRVIGDYQELLTEKDRVLRELPAAIATTAAAERLTEEVQEYERTLEHLQYQAEIQKAMALELDFQEVTARLSQYDQFLNETLPAQLRDQTITQADYEEMRAKAQERFDDVDRERKLISAGCANWTEQTTRLLEPYLKKFDLTPLDLMSVKDIDRLLEEAGRRLAENQALSQQANELLTHIHDLDDQLLDILEQPKVVDRLLLPVEAEQSATKEEVELRSAFIDEFMRDRKVTDVNERYPLNQAALELLTQAFLDIELAEAGLNRSDLSIEERARGVRQLMTDLHDGLRFKHQLTDLMTTSDVTEREELLQQFRARPEAMARKNDLVYFLNLTNTTGLPPRDAPYMLAGEVVAKGIGLQDPQFLPLLAKRLRRFLPLINIIKAASDANRQIIGYHEFAPTMTASLIQPEFVEEGVTKIGERYQVRIGQRGEAHLPLRDEQNPEHTAEDKRLVDIYRRSLAYFRQHGETAATDQMTGAREEYVWAKHEKEILEKQVHDLETELREKRDYARQMQPGLPPEFYPNSQIELQRLLAERDKARERSQGLGRLNPWAQKTYQKSVDKVRAFFGATLLLYHFAGFTGQSVPDPATATLEEIRAVVDRNHQIGKQKHVETWQRIHELEGYHSWTEPIASQIALAQKAVQDFGPRFDDVVRSPWYRLAKQRLGSTLK